jgi:transcriptional regulator NrdR family protein
MKKNQEVRCPKCGSYATDLYDRDFDGETMREERYCTECDAEWDEFFKVEYTGYACKGVDYDKDGDEMFPDDGQIALDLN